MFSRVMSAAIRGVSIEIVYVETDISDGMPVFDMVGLLSSEVKESRERVRTSMKNSGWKLPPKRITVNLSPAGMPKEGGAFDLPIAMGILMTMNQVHPVINMEETLIAGEVSLDGTVNAIRGVLPMVIAGKEQGIRNFLVPKRNAAEGMAIEGVRVMGVESLLHAKRILEGEVEAEEGKEAEKEVGKRDTAVPDFLDIRGQENVKRAAQIAAAGMHHMLMIGPPGGGKTMVASRISGILPEPDREECIEITKIHSIAGILGEQSMITKRPFRAPHHTVTERALLGGGARVHPGELTLAHRGVLFLDEFAEFKRGTIEALRKPLEEGEIVISRVYGTYVFPAQFMLVAASNPCKCGYYPDRKKCSCTEYEVKKYMAKMSRPLIDRMDLCVLVPEVAVEALQNYPKGQTSAQIRSQVEAAAMIQKERYAGTHIRFNARLTQQDIGRYCYLGKQEKTLLSKAFHTLHMSARAYYKTIKVARTIADLEGSLNIRTKHLSEALGYRMMH